MDNYTKSLRERKAAAWHEYTSLVEAAGAENRDLTPEEMEQRDRIESALDSLNAEEKRHVERVATADFADSIRAATVPAIEAAARNGEKRSENEILRELITRGGSVSLEQRALGNTPSGGSAVPTRFSGMFVEYERTLNPTIAVANVIETADNAPIEIYTKTADQAYGGTVTAENAGIVAADPTLGKITLLTYKYPSITFVSSELWRSNVIDLAGVLARGAARELGLDLGAHLTTGDGSDKPNGFIAAGGNGGTAALAAPGTAGTFFSAGDLITLFYSLAAPYRANGVWMMNSTALAKVRRMQDDNGNLLFNPLGEGINGPVSGTLMGKPVYENVGMADPASAAKAVAFGDFSYYAVRRLPLRVDVDFSFKFQDDQVAVRTILEADGDLTDSNAIKYQVCANA